MSIAGRRRALSASAQKKSSQLLLFQDGTYGPITVTKGNHFKISSIMTGWKTVPLREDVQVNSTLVFKTLPSNLEFKVRIKTVIDGVAREFVNTSMNLQTGVTANYSGQLSSFSFKENTVTVDDLVMEIQAD